MVTIEMEVEEDQLEEEMEIPPDERKIDVVENLEPEDSKIERLI